QKGRRGMIRLFQRDNKGELADYDKGAARWRASAGRGDGRCQPLSALPHRTQTIGPCEPMQFD
ncbi:hypothetical protein, partial [Escherichia coli]|uniref:hypothetical protein n=2 Tax=Pseudomonadota TaxID=1224 RepID=UPI001952ACD1